MKKKTTLIILSFISLCFTGCVQVSGTKSAIGELKVNTHRFLWASEGIDFSVKDTNGFNTSLKVNKSQVDTEAIAAIAAGIAQGMGTAAKTAVVP